ncbi:hypothetical protein E0H75_07245 [Kribbella capetownensis]|uniref:Uncharacterized protein n=2 Tax=Kribbella capetownensis TaxID=1572659 RepID=A0A4R0K8C4_9ACTN|nr:hypothetical protein E0H75_07245 [Kribbella capetownensis]
MITNALSPLRVIEALKALVKPDGTIGLMSSGEGSIANNTRGGFEIYRASKSALNQLVRSYAVRNSDDPRTLLLIPPGWANSSSPLSDRVGRFKPLLIGTALCLLAGLVAAFAPTVSRTGRAGSRGEREHRSRMAHRGLIERGTGYRRYHRPSLEALRDRDEPIALSEAARILSRTIGDVRELVAAGVLGPCPNSTFPVFRREVERYAESHPPRSDVQAGRSGQVNVVRAAELLTLPTRTVHRLARSGRLPCEPGPQGRYWFQHEHLAMYLRARDTEESFKRFGLLPTTP